MCIFGAFRVSELVRVSKVDNSKMTLQMDNLLVYRVLFHLRRSKMDQLGNEQVISLGRCSAGELSLVRVISDYVELQRTSAGDVFCHRDSSLLTRYQFWTVTSRGFGKQE